jgi:aspartate/methionine/tyrosine aminotransferase
MSLEDWFDTHQYRTKFDAGESAVKFVKLGDLGLDLNSVPLRYGYHTGQPALRERIVEEYPGLGMEQILVTSGGAEAIFAITAALVKPGEHVIVEHPNYPSTYEVARGLGAEVSLLKLRFEDAFRPDLDRLDEMIKPSTKLMIFTHPNNPTGSMISRAELDRLIAFAESRRIYLLFDETYRHLTFGEKLPPAATLSDRAISVTGMSKCYGLPGIRIGWLASKSREILDGVLAVREQVSITNTALSEAIAIAVLAQREEFLSKAQRHVAANLAIAKDWMGSQPWLEWVPPQGGVVFSPRIRADWPGDPEQFYTSLAVDDGVFVIPGRCFEMDNRFFRLGCGAAADELKQGLRIIGEKLAKGARA